MNHSIKRVIIFTIFICLCFFTSCTNPYWGNYVERNSEKNLELLKKYSVYNQQEKSYSVITSINAERAEEIKNYFADKNMPAEWLDSTKSTWDRAMAVAKWVSKNVKHSNPDPWPDHLNCIDLYEWNLTHKKGFNCRMHSIMLNELLLAAGIENRFVTCLPEDSEDPDCHVVNIVWLPEHNKWAMIDSDMTEYVVDENNIPLSLQEMRDYLVNDKEFTILPFDGFRIDEEYLHAYWIKNLFCFSSHTLNAFSVEDTQDGNLLPGDKHIFLYPQNFLLEKLDTDYSESEIKILSSNKNMFWGK